MRLVRALLSCLLIGLGCGRSGSDMAKAGARGLPSASSVVHAMTVRYRSAKAYADTGTVEVTFGSWMVANREVKRFNTLFERSSAGFRMDITTPGTRSASVLWRAGPGPVASWSKRTQTTSHLSLEDALYVELLHRRGSMTHAPAVLLLLGKVNETFEGFHWDAVQSDSVANRSCYRVEGSADERSVSLWIARDDHALLRVVEKDTATFALMGGIQTAIDYAPSFDKWVDTQRFDFSPPNLRLPPDRCTGLGVVADGRDPLIDDIDDGDIQLRHADHRNGRWWIYGDEGCDVVPGNGARAEPPGGKSPARYAVHVGARHCGEWGFGIGFALNEAPARCAYDASVYDGVYFWARSGHEPVPIRFTIGSRKTQPIEYGGDGTCEHSGRTNCWESHWVPLTVTPEWRAYAVRWKDLHEPAWELHTPFDLHEITSFGWNASDKLPATLREIWIGRAGFFKGSPPVAPFGEVQTVVPGP